MKCPGFAMQYEMIEIRLILKIKHPKGPNFGLHTISSITQWTFAVKDKSKS